jgi:hypothetical protein
VNVRKKAVSAFSPKLRWHIPEVAFLEQPIWRFLGNRFVEAHIRGNAQAKGSEFVEMGISFAAPPYLPKFRSSRESHFSDNDIYLKVQNQIYSVPEEFKFKRDSSLICLDREQQDLIGFQEAYISCCATGSLSRSQLHRDSQFAFMSVCPSVIYMYYQLLSR